MEALLLEQIIGSKGPLAGKNVKDVNSVSGGCIHDAWCIAFNNGEKVFVKTTSIKNFEMLSFEAIGLSSLQNFAEDSLLSTPKPLTIQKLETHSILIMPWVDFSQGNAINLGRGLALLHKASKENHNGSFGWGNDGFIGLGPQPKGWEESWGECFINLRLIPQIKIAKKWGLRLIELKKFLSNIKSYLNKHHPEPSLVHGDLWQGNAGIDQSGRGVIFDPAVWWADREVDISMTRLFGGFSKDFYDGYDEVWPLTSSWIERIDIYNLYHLINHANLFGGSYEEQCIESIKRISRLVN